MESLRAQKIIGKPLEAKLEMYVDEKAESLLNSIKEDVKTLFIVSEFVVAGKLADAPAEADKYEHVAIVATKAEGETCERCRVTSKELGKNEAHPTLCPRCTTVVVENYNM